MLRKLLNNNFRVAEAAAEQAEILMKIEILDLFMKNANETFKLKVSRK